MTSNAELFRFLQKLVNDMYEDLELPGFPDVVVRLQQTLADEKSNARDIVRLVSSDAALSARLLQLANSVAFKPGDRDISDLKAAVTVLGFSLVRGTATSFAVRQMEQQAWLLPLKPHLHRIWQDSTGVAAICYVGARHIAGMRPDEALAAGLFHQIGTLYVLTRAHKEGIAIGDTTEWTAAIADWTPTIARAILENWRVPEHLTDAVEHQDALGREDPGELSLLARLLAAAKLYQQMQTPQGDHTQAQAVLANVKFGAQPFLEMTQSARDEIEAVRRVIGQ
ncbi:MAG: HDOD domain-containing protein [Gammaproteobacteria bacterium]|nr:HDOD domain-containing protein [Gammaproteobacteria bacterium]